MSLFKEIFAWWTGNTIGTRLAMWRMGAQLVGEDELGNRYFQAGDRRMALYAGGAEASKIPPLWHGWLHYIYDDRPLPIARAGRAWQKPHQPNATGTVQAYHPPGSTFSGGKRARVSADYEPWTPR